MSSWFSHNILWKTPANRFDFPRALEDTIQAISTRTDWREPNDGIRSRKPRPATRHPDAATIHPCPAASRSRTAASRSRTATSRSRTATSFRMGRRHRRGRAMQPNWVWSLHHAPGREAPRRPASRNHGAASRNHGGPKRPARGAKRSASRSHGATSRSHGATPGNHGGARKPTPRNHEGYGQSASGKHGGAGRPTISAHGTHPPHVRATRTARRLNARGRERQLHPLFHLGFFFTLASHGARIFSYGAKKCSKHPIASSGWRDRSRKFFSGPGQAHFLLARLLRGFGAGRSFKNQSSICSPSQHTTPGLDKICSKASRTYFIRCGEPDR